MADSEHKERPRLIAQRYEVLCELGAGGMGVVYKARDSMLKNIVAIKMIRSSTMSAEEFLRFQLEAKAAGNLKHPSIVTIFTFGMDDDRPYMIMEYAEGNSLQAYLENNGPLTLSEAVPIISQICDGMAHAHRKGIVHRDLKPSNILLSPQDSGELRVRILDFGIAKIVADESFATQAGQILGSPRYMSPEQFAGRKLDARSDVYSLGCVIFEMLTGKAPYASDKILELRRKHESDPIPQLNEICPEKEFAPVLQTVLQKALAKSAASRYKNMEALKGALLYALNNPDATPGEFRLKMLSPFHQSQRKMFLAVVIASIVLLIVVIPWPWVMHFFVAPPRVSKGDSGLGHWTNPAVDEWAFHSKGQPAAGKSSDQIRKVKPDKNGILELSGSTFSDTDIDVLPANLKGINLDGTKITDAGLEKLAKRCKELTVVHLLVCDGITDKGIDALASMPLLADLDLCSKNLTIEGFKKFPRFKRVERLNLEGNITLTDDCMKYVRQVKNIHRLFLAGTSLTGKGLSHLQGRELVSIDMRLLNLKDEDLKQFNKLCVKDLILTQNPLTPKALEYLDEFPCLTSVTLNRTPGIRLEDIEAFEKHSKLFVRRDEM